MIAMSVAETSSSGMWVYKRPAPSPDTSTGEDDYTKLQRREPPATINDAPLIANADVSATNEIPPSYEDFAIRIHDGSPQSDMMR